MTPLVRALLYNGSTDSFENFTAELSASEPVVYKSRPPTGPDILYTTALLRRVKLSVANFASSGGGVKACLRNLGLGSRKGT